MNLCVSRFLFGWALLLPLLTVGCQDHEEKAPTNAATGVAIAQAAPDEPQDAGATLPPERNYPLKYYNLDLAGTEDLRNRYSAAVNVYTHELTLAGAKGHCSGVLLSPQLVLTSGHCVCTQRPVRLPGNEGLSIIDATSCAQNPEVLTIVWEPPRGYELTPSGLTRQTYTGIEVRPHPDFQIFLDATGQVISSRADLAIIFLKTPVQEKYSPLQIADEEIHDGETFVLVGGRSGEFQGNGGGDRRFMRYKAIRFMAPGSDRVLFDQPYREAFKGDSGGPCVRDVLKGPLLLGISARGLGKDATFTSIHPYRSWLRAALRSAKPK
jgi:hypothetical protein